MYEVELYTTESGRAPVQEFIKDLAKKNKQIEIAQIRAYEERLEQFGMSINNYYPNSIRPIQDDVYELRPGGNRVFFFYFTGNRFILLHAYRKHGQKAPKNEIDKAVKEMKDFKRRNSHGK